MNAHVLIGEFNFEGRESFSKALRLGLVNLVKGTVVQCLARLAEVLSRVDVNRVSNLVTDDNSQEGQLQVPWRKKMDSLAYCPLV